MPYQRVQASNQYCFVALTTLVSVDFGKISNYPSIMLRNTREWTKAFLWNLRIEILSAGLVQSIQQWMSTVHLTMRMGSAGCSKLLQK